ncbi:iris-like [Haemaphysalis longicornis]
MVPTISQTGCFRMATCDELGATALELPYRSPASTAENASRGVSPPFGATTTSAETSWDPEFSLVILLPNEKDGLTKLMDKLSAFTLQRCLSQLKSNGQVHVSLPLFKVKQVTDLVPALSALGVSDVFTERAELWGAKAGKKRVSGLRNAAAFRTAHAGGRRPWEQKRLNQKRRPVGADLAVTLAHAVYSIIKPHQQPVHFIVDRPFVFLVIHVHPDTLLLLGCVRKITW